MQSSVVTARKSNKAVSRKVSTLPANMDIKVRHPRFDLAKDRKFWLDNDPVMSRVVDALSMFFPDGEKFFIDSVLRFKKEITDPELKKQVAAFSGQEAAHTAEHRKYNKLAAGDKAPTYEYVAKFLLGVGRKTLTRRQQLAVTVALEHLTATLGDLILNDTVTAGKMDIEHRKLLLWHAAEETEHKSVAFDVYRLVGGDYPTRAVALVGATFFLILATAGVTTSMLWRDGQLFKARNLKSLYQTLFAQPGLIRNMAPDFLDYFRPDFTPWDHNNSALLKIWKTNYAEA